MPVVRARSSRIEQILAAGADAQNILLAMHALGFRAAGKNGEAAYDRVVKARSVSGGDHVGGLIYTGARRRDLRAGQSREVQDAIAGFPVIIRD